MEQIQKQRLEFEDLLASKMREREDTLMRQTNAALQEKDAGMEAILTTIKESLEAEHAANLESQKALLQAECSLHYETEYAQKLAELKEKFVTDLESKVRTMEALATKLAEMEQALTTTRSFTDGSVKAHRVSAAALALAEKLETSQGAKAEVGALEVCIPTLFAMTCDVESNIAAHYFVIRLLPQKTESFHQRSVLFPNLSRLVSQLFRNCKRNFLRSTTKVDRLHLYQQDGLV